VLRSIVAIIVLAHTPALAQERQLTPRQEEARQHYAVGEGLANNRDWAGALREFEQAYELAEDLPNRYLIGLDIALANEEIGRYPQAIEGYERFLEVAPPTEERRAQAEARLRELRIRVDLQRGYSPSPIGLIIAGVGAAAAIAGGIIGGIALAQDGDARAQCTTTSCPEADWDALAGAHDLAIVADAVLWSGVGILAVGIVLTFVLAENGSATASAACTSDGCRAVVRGRF
jgi:tetratricopeptide (TPR) repeat protein